MEMQTHGPFSARLADLHASPIREILSVIDRPGMVSFAGGLPAAETFPALKVDAIPRALLQYGPSEGEPELREAVAADLDAIGLKCSAGQVLILSGSQQGIDLVAKLFIDPGTTVALESPTYLAALQVFRFFGAQFLPLDPSQPSAAWPKAVRPSFIYTIPTFQNPTGALLFVCRTRGAAAFLRRKGGDLVRGRSLSGSCLRRL